MTCLPDDFVFFTKSTSICVKCNNNHDFEGWNNYFVGYSGKDSCLTFGFGNATVYLNFTAADAAHNIIIFKCVGKKIRQKKNHYRVDLLHD